MIAFSCPRCGKSGSVKDEFCGRETKCPECNTPIHLPAAIQPTAVPLAPDRPAYKWNAWQVAAFVCWIVGALTVIVPAVWIIRAFRGDVRMDDTTGYIATL